MKTFRSWLFLSILVHLILLILFNFIKSDAKDEKFEEKRITFDLVPEKKQEIPPDLPQPKPPEQEQPPIPEDKPEYIDIPDFPQNSETRWNVEKEGQPKEKKLSEAERKIVEKLLENRKQKKDFSKDFLGEKPIQEENAVEYREDNSENSNLNRDGMSEDVVFSVTDFEGYESYRYHVLRSVRRNWFPPRAFTDWGSIWGSCKIQFRILKDGSITEPKLLESTQKEPNGHKSLDEAAINAIKGAAKFKPLPPDFPEEDLAVTFTFNYIVLSR